MNAQQANGAVTAHSEARAAVARFVDGANAARRSMDAAIDELVRLFAEYGAYVAALPVTKLDSGLIDRKEAALLLAVGDTVLSEWVSRGLVPHKRLPPGSEDASRNIIRFSRRELEQWLDERTCGQKS